MGGPRQKPDPSNVVVDDRDNSKLGDHQAPEDARELERSTQDAGAARSSQAAGGNLDGHSPYEGRRLGLEKPTGLYKMRGVSLFFLLLLMAMALWSIFLSLTEG